MKPTIILVTLCLLWGGVNASYSTSGNNIQHQNLKINKKSHLHVTMWNMY